MLPVGRGREKRRFVASFRAEPRERDDLVQLHAHMTAAGWNTQPLKDTDRAMYGLLECYSRKDISGAHSTAWFAVKRVLRRARAGEMASVTIKVTEYQGEGTDLDPTDVDRVKVESAD